MTLIVGIKCANGVVLGADGVAMMGSLGQQTARQPKKKLTIIGGSVVVGTSGYVGLGQRVCSEIEQLWVGNAFSGKLGAPTKPEKAMVTIRDALWEHLGKELHAAAVAKDAIGAAAHSGAICLTVVGMPIGSKPQLFQFDQQGSPEMATDDLPFVSIGSGQAIADPFLGFIRRIFWEDHAPNLSEGVFATLWTLQHAIKIAPIGIGDPPQIVVLEQQGKDWKARELSNPEMDEHRQAIDSAEKALRDYKGSFKVGSAPPVPEPPPKE